MAVHLAVTGDVFDGVLFCAGTELNQFLNFFNYSKKHISNKNKLMQY